METPNAILTVESKGKVCVVKFKCSEIGMDESGGFYEELKKLANSGKLFILVDFSNVAYISSLVLAALISGLKNTKSKGGSLKLCCLQDKVRQTIEMTQLNKVFEVYPDVDTALKDGKWEKGEVIEFK